MYTDYFDYDHPALYLYLVEQRGARHAWQLIKHRREEKRISRKKGNRRVRRAIKQYLQFGSKPRLRSRAIGDGYDIA